MGLLRTIAIILLVYFALRLLSRWLAPKLFGFAAKKAQAHFEEMYGMGRPQEVNEESAGEVTVDKSTKKRKSDTDKVGEYIEFEEIE